MVDESAWLKGSNRRATAAGSMPMPVSETSKRTRCPRRVGSPSVTRTVIPPSEVNLTALESRLVTHLLEAEAIAAPPAAARGAR